MRTKEVEEGCCIEANVVSLDVETEVKSEDALRQY